MTTGITFQPPQRTTRVNAWLARHQADLIQPVSIDTRAPGKNRTEPEPSR